MCLGRVLRRDDCGELPRCYSLSFRGAQRRGIWSGAGPHVPRFLPAVGMTLGAVGMTLGTFMSSAWWIQSRNRPRPRPLVIFLPGRKRNIHLTGEGDEIAGAEPEYPLSELIQVLPQQLSRLRAYQIPI